MSRAKAIAAKAKGGGKPQPAPGENTYGQQGGKGGFKDTGLGGVNEASNEDLMNRLGIGGASAYVKHPKKFFRNLIHGKGPAMSKLMMLRQASHDLGYDTAQNDLQQHYSGQLDQAEAGQVPGGFREDQSPTYDKFQWYVGEHLGTGFSPEERAAYFGAQKDVIGANAGETEQNEMTRLAAAGIDPRSGIAANRAAAISAETGREMAGAARDTEQANLARKRDFEGYGAGMSGLEEQRRAGEVAQANARAGQVEGGYGNLAGLAERGREYDVGYTENQRQAKLARQDMLKAAKDMQPGTFDKVAAGIGGFVGGLSGGGGGGMGG